jgi:hypothetical protein
MYKKFNLFLWRNQKIFEMKELELAAKDTVEVVGEKEIESKQVFVKHLRPKSGHTLFEYNSQTNVLQKAAFEVVQVKFEDAQNGNVHTNKKVVLKPYCYYVSCLNVKNAIRHFRKMLKSNITPELV